ncbi:MAG: ribonuclease HII [Gammaproteobacteria bacterium]|nr:ribonuclease HII [Gammaproteobacteria bacterium]MDP2140963.1 ribonuclease HII [Gammaproteobacteria bacterium]MDP2349293.1 ribonuclease HII [Gammaproteobacteria bacterium]
MQLSFPYPSSSTTEYVAGVDEVGRGPLAGDVVAAAVILDPARPISNLNDSKKMTERQREYVFQTILESALCYALGRASVVEIDNINILQASLLAMSRAVAALSTQPGFVYVDGLHCPHWAYPSSAVVKGDSKVDCIAAASIVAKVIRDREMQDLDSRYPGYGFAIHKGYPTKAHLLALHAQGACEIHRRSFKPVQLVLSRADM